MTVLSGSVYERPFLLLAHGAPKYHHLAVANRCGSQCDPILGKCWCGSAHKPGTLRDRACNHHSEKRSFLGAKMKANRAGLTACLAMLTTACGGGDSDSSSSESNTEYMMRGEFPSMARCLEAIQQKAGQALKPVTDRPDQVSGNLSDGRFFICERKDSGTKGTYYEGTFTGVSKD